MRPTLCHDNFMSSGVQERVESMGYATFSILFSVLDIGVVIVRIVGLVALSGSPGLAMGLILVSLWPSVILPLLAYLVESLKRRKRESGGDGEVESGISAATADESES